jgi:hypothetical protein
MLPCDINHALQALNIEVCMPSSITVRPGVKRATRSRYLSRLDPASLRPPPHPFRLPPDFRSSPNPWRLVFFQQIQVLLSQPILIRKRLLFRPAVLLPPRPRDQLSVPP